MSVLAVEKEAGRQPGPGSSWLAPLVQRKSERGHGHVLSDHAAGPKKSNPELSTSKQVGIGLHVDVSALDEDHFERKHRRSLVHTTKSAQAQSDR